MSQLFLNKGQTVVSGQVVCEQGIGYLDHWICCCPSGQAVVRVSQQLLNKGLAVVAVHMLYLTRSQCTVYCFTVFTVPEKRSFCPSGQLSLNEELAIV